MTLIDVSMVHVADFPQYLLRALHHDYKSDNAGLRILWT